MKRLLLLTAAFACCAAAQSIVDVQNMAAVASAAVTPLQTLTGADGTVCKISKVPGKTIYVYFTCTLGGQSLSPAVIQSSGAASGNAIISQGGVMCYFGVNPTAVAVGYGSVGTAPAGGVAWSCAAGGTAVNGTVSWP